MYEFDYAISFSRECRSVAKELADRLHLRGAAVFYDGFYRAHLLGQRLGRVFAWVFADGTRFFVPIVSASYANSTWPQHEWTIARHEAKNRQEEFILPIRVDDSLLLGLPDTVCYVDLRDHTVDTVADLLIEKLGGSTIANARPHGDQTWVAAFSLLTQNLLDSEDLPPEAPLDYAGLCDWLTENLKARLASTSLVNPRLTEDARNGETFGLRVAFEWGPARGPMEFGDSGWWELMEVLPYKDVHGSAMNTKGIG